MRKMLAKHVLGFLSRLHLFHPRARSPCRSRRRLSSSSCSPRRCRSSSRLRRRPLCAARRLRRDQPRREPLDALDVGELVRGELEALLILRFELLFFFF